METSPLLRTAKGSRPLGTALAIAARSPMAILPVTPLMRLFGAAAIVKDIQ